MTVWLSGVNFADGERERDKEVLMDFTSFCSLHSLPLTLSVAATLQDWRAMLLNMCFLVGNRVLVRRPSLIVTFLRLARKAQDCLNFENTLDYGLSYEYNNA